MFTAFSGKLKSLIYEDQPALVPAVQTTPSTQAMTQLSQPTVVGTIAQDQTVVAMTETIKKATFARNTAFTQLLQAGEALADVIPDQVMRLKAAHKTAGGGRTGRQIADAVDVHLQDIDGEEMRFKQLIDTKLAQELALLERTTRVATETIAAATNEIALAEARVLQLQTENAQNQAALVTWGTEAATAKQSAEVTQSQFKAAAIAVRQELQASKAAVLSILV